MALSPRIEIRQGQTLVMTPQLQQAIKLLQLSNVELTEFVASEVEKNPFLDLARPAAPPAPMSSASQAVGRRSEVDAILDTFAADVTLREHLQTQIRRLRINPINRNLALLLIDELDEDGYLRIPLPSLAARLKFPVEPLAKALELVQSCEPSGVGARHLRECLELQLRDRNRLDPAMQTLLENLELLAGRRLAELRDLCGVDAADFADMLHELRALNPKPGHRYGAENVSVALPDVHVTKMSPEGWRVELNSYTLPRILVNNAYAAEVSARDVTARAFVSECSARANWLVRSLEQRARTILKVASEIVTHQQSFFSGGVGHLRPLTLRAIADRLGIHESTVSRATAGKYLSCDRGLFEFRFFFGQSVAAVSGREELSAAAVQDQIKVLIQREKGGKTLSDGKIVEILKGQGIVIARRTVAKYRDILGIPSSVDRRRLQSFCTTV